MNVDSRRAPKLSLAQKFSRLAVRLRDPEWHRYGGTLLAGKLLGVGLALAIMAVVSAAFFAHVYAQMRPQRMKQPALRFWPSGFFSLPSRIRAQPSPRAQ